MTGLCQVSCCLNEAQVELTLEADVAVWVCATCSLDKNTVPAFIKGPSAGLYYVEDKRTVLACEGDAVFCKPEFAIADVYTARPGDPYMLPCLHCQTPFVFHWDIAYTMACEKCRTASPSVAEPEPEIVTLEDLWTHIDPKHKAQISEHYEERAAIMEYEGGMQRYVAELAALRLTTELCETHGLLQ